MIKKVECIVLRAINYGDTSKILTVLTKEYGKISVIAKGMKSKSKTLGAATSLVGVIINAIIYMRPGRDVQLITEIQVKRMLYSVHHTLEKLNMLYEAVELVLFCTARNETNVKLYSLLWTYLAHLEEKELQKNYRLFFFKFFLEVLSLLGFEINTKELVSTNHLSGRVVPKSKDASFFYIVSDGKFVTETQNKSGISVMKETVATMTELGKRSIENLTNLNATPEVIEEIDKILSVHLEFYLDKACLFKSKKVFLEMQPLLFSNNHPVQ